MNSGESFEVKLTMQEEYNRLLLLASKAQTDLIVARNTLNIILPRMQEINKRLGEIIVESPF
jgi:hypothetical protein